MDVGVYIEPAGERDAIEALSKKITQFESQLMIELEAGNNRNITNLQKKIDDSINLRAKLEQNREKLFYTKIYCNLYAKNLEQLNKEGAAVTNHMKARSAELTPSFLQQDIGYLSCMPYGKSYSNDLYRNVSAGALTACFPFYNSEITHPNGVFLGLNLPSRTPVFLNPFSREYLPNNNISVFGMSGSGKTFLTSLLIMRLALNGVTTVIIDPEGEYEEITKNLGGTTISFGTDTGTRINPFDIEEEVDVDLMGRETRSINMDEKIADILNLVGIMSKNISREQESLIGVAIAELYEEFGISEDPNSIYNQEDNFDEATGTYYQKGRKKKMPTLTDLYHKLEAKSKETDQEVLLQIANSLKMFLRGEVYGIFDGQTNIDIDFSSVPIITFDVKSLEEGTFRPIGMYQALSWVWEKFVKKDPNQKKMVMVDEAWMLVSPDLPGSEYTAGFLNKASRRIRKRNAGLIIASQSFNEFKDNPLGRAVLTNTSLNILLKQQKVDIKAVQEVFNLSDGESMELLTATVGDAILKIGEESAKIKTMAFDFEYRMIVPKHLQKKTV